MNRIMRRSRARRCAAALLLAASLQGAGAPGSSTALASTTLNLVAYSTPAAAYAQLIPAFQKTSAGKDVSFTQSYGASGDQASAVGNGQKADIVEFSIALDMLYLQHRGLVASSWNESTYRGMVTNSIVVIGVRKGNPKHIHTWNDLLKPGIEVITPNPFTSGSARWNIMAAYGAQIVQHRTKTQAVTFLKKLFTHISVQDTSGRAATNTFASGKGDALLTYENEAIGARQKGVSLDYVIPPQSILIENPIAVTKSGRTVPEATAFVSFLYSTAGQRIFGQNGYRPVRSDVLKQFHFHNPKTLFTIHTLGSWPSVQRNFFDPEYGIVAQIERGKGVTP